MATAASNVRFDVASFNGHARVSNGPNNSTSAAPADGLDDLFDYDASMEEMLRDVDNSLDTTTRNAQSGPTAGNIVGGAKDILGIDEEIKVTKKPRINVKLDENRLLSQAGIPKLRRITKERLRFKGKGHEVGDPL